MVFQKITAQTFPEIIRKMIDYNQKYKCKHVYFEDIKKEKNLFKTVATRNGTIFE